jgi:hypothetical protein
VDRRDLGRDGGSLDVGADAVPREPWSAWLLCLTLGGVVALGALKLHYPFAIDQSVFATFARMMDDGAVLYVDVWDPKQPGIFYYYLAAGRLFGFTEVGANAFNLLWLIAGSLVGMRFLRRHLSLPVLSYGFPVLAVGGFYLLGTPTSLGQVEVISGPIIMLYLVLAHPPATGGPSRLRLVGAGLAGAAVGWLKLFLLLVPAVMAVVAAIALQRGSRPVGPSAARYLGYQLAGVSIGLALLLLWAALNGSLEQLWFTYVEYPLQVVEERQLQRIRPVLFRGFAVCAPAGALGIAAVLRVRGDRQRAVHVAMVVAWLVMAGLVIAPQTWQTYHVDSLFFPAALLALEGLDAVVVRFGPRAGLAGSAVALALAAPGLVTIGGPRLAAEVEHRAGFVGDRDAFKSELYPWYGPSLEALDAVQLRQDETVASLGHAGLVIFHSGLDQGTSLQPYQAEARIRDAVTETRSMRPTWFLFPELGQDVPTSSYHELEHLLEREYERVGSVELGTWYRRR